MFRDLQAWCLGRLDALLTEEQRRLPPDELSRVRVLAGAAALNLVMAVSNMVGPEAPAHGTLFRLVGIFFSACYLSALVLMRRGGSLRLPGLLVCSALTLGIFLTARLIGTPAFASHAAIMLTPALAVYLLGARLGFVFTVAMGLYVLVINPLLWGGGKPGHPFFADATVRFAAIAGVISLLGGWFLSWLHSSARQEAHDALQRSESRLMELHRSLMQVSRQAGMAEISTRVLHDVGNTLNGVTVSVGLVLERARNLRLAGVEAAARLLRENAENPVAFLREDPQGRQLPAYLQALSGELFRQQAELVNEVQALNTAMTQIQTVLAVQQRHARPVELLEQVSVSQLIDDALRLQRAALERSGIQVRTQYAEVPPLRVDRHKLLQILTNLLSNACQALEEGPLVERQLTLRVGLTAPKRLRIEVEDNGVGIAPEHLPLLFTQGFTTRETGHGFGLHLSALSAGELGGSLTAASKGRGQGATFILEVPLEPEESPARA